MELESKHFEAAKRNIDEVFAVERSYSAALQELEKLKDRIETFVEICKERQ